MTTPRPVVAFIDTGAATQEAATASLVELAGADRLGIHVSRAFAVAPGFIDATLPPGWTVTSGRRWTDVCQWAFDAAAAADQNLLVISGDWRPTAEAVSALAEALQVDPLFGFAVPRLTVGDGQHVWSAPSWDEAGTPVAMRVLAHTRDFRIVADTIAPFVLIRREIVGSLPSEAGTWRGVAGMVADFAIRARRAGFRTVLCNRVVVDAGPGAGEPATLDDLERRRLEASYPDLGMLTSARNGPPAGPGERLLTAAFEKPDSLLIDSRNLGTIYNGTSTALLGMADALHRTRPGPHVTLWAHEDVANWHRLRERYSTWTLHFVGAPPVPHAAGVRLSQPWHLSELETLAAAAAVNVYWVLDTIAWDVVYTAPDGLDQTWARMSDEADAMLFISEFSRQRFLHRFEPAIGVQTGVCYLSLSAADYLGAGAGTPPEGPYWLVVGNRYDHKHVGPTVDLLTRSFPRQRLVVFGDRDQVRGPLVTRFDSGRVDEPMMQACFAAADLVVFPSFYEGFGLPMVQGLARGRTVVARASALVDELAAAYSGPGRLLTYTSDRDLVTLLNRAVRGDVPTGVRLGPPAGTEPWTWDLAARTLLTTVDALVQAAPSRQMLRRTGLARGLEHPVRERP